MPAKCEIRKIIYITNVIESPNSSFRKISRHRNLFPSVDPPWRAIKEWIPDDEPGLD